MKKSDIYEIAIKILGLYLLTTIVVEFLNQILKDFMVMQQFQGNSDGTPTPNFKPYIAISILNVILLSLLSIFMMFKTKIIAKRICSQSDFEEDVKLFADPKTIYEILLNLNGLLLVIWTLPEFAYKLKNYILAEQIKGWHADIDYNFLVISSIKIIFGIFILVISKPLSKYFAGSQKQLQNQD